MSGSGKLTAEQVTEVVTRYNAGESMASIAISYGVSRPAISGLLNRRNVTTRCDIMLTPRQRGEIARMYRDGMKVSAISLAQGVSDATVRRSLHGQGIKLRTRGLNESAWDKLTPEASYWIGFLFADGCIHKRNGYAPQISVRLSRKDVGHLRKLRSHLGSDHAISESLARSDCAFSVRSGRLAARLLALGRYEGVVDHELSRSSDFWRGVVDGDGSLGIYGGKPQFRLVGDLRLMTAFAEFVSQAELGEVQVRRHKSIYIVGVSSSPARRIVGGLYGHATVALDRKLATACLIMGLDQIGHGT